VDDCGTRFIEFGLGDPLSLEGAQARQDGTTDPDGESSFSGGNDLDLDGGGSQSGDFLAQSVGNTVVHGSTTGHDDVAVQVLSDIDVALHDRLEGEFVDTGEVLAVLHGLEQGFGASEGLVADSDDLTIGHGVVDFFGGGFVGGLEFSVEVEGDVAELFLDVSGNFSFGRRGETDTDFSEELHHVIGKVSTGQIDSHDGVGKGVTFVDGDSVGDTITGIEDDTGSSTRSVQGEDGLDRNVERGDVEGFEHDLGHLFSVGLGVHGGFGEEGGVLFGVNSEFVEVAVMPDLFHVFPGGDDTVFNGVLELEDTSLGLGFFTDVNILLFSTDHSRTSSLGSSDDGGEADLGGIFTSNTSLAHTRTVIDNDSVDRFLTHDFIFCVLN